MTLQQRQNNLIKQISGVKDENILILLEEELACYSQHKGAEGLSRNDLNELTTLADEPSHKDTVTETEYLNATGKWRLK